MDLYRLREDAQLLPFAQLIPKIPHLCNTIILNEINVGARILIMGDHGVSFLPVIVIVPRPLEP